MYYKKIIKTVNLIILQKDTEILMDGVHKQQRRFKENVNKNNT